ncbi:hypothetical protein GGX14DRAFT_676259 [Mycena pura]|uniref:Uncharacterized protein n=1 Tax=Mycena pura TaxID=153505 RepID=A0AAD6VSV8_9AGAR|nr:hypothetical protein GGX14DRAFT_676259 [Mycena pura]
MDLQVHPKVLAAPPKNLNTGNTEIAWFWIKDCSDKRVCAMENLTIRYTEGWEVNDPHQGSRMRPRSRKSTKDWWRDGRDKRGGIPVSEALVKGVSRGQYPPVATVVRKLVPPVHDLRDHLYDGMVPLANRQIILQCLGAFRQCIRLACPLTLHLEHSSGLGVLMPHNPSESVASLASLAGPVLRHASASPTRDAANVVDKVDIPVSLAQLFADLRAACDASPPPALCS